MSRGHSSPLAHYSTLRLKTPAPGNWSGLLPITRGRLSLGPSPPGLVQALHYLDLPHVVEIVAHNAEQEIHEPVVPAARRHLVQPPRIKRPHCLDQLGVL